jgi:Fe-S oxidoreductase
VLFADTFNRYFEPKNLEAAVQVLAALGYHVTHPEPTSGSRPLCCGRTFLSAGFIDEAKAESARFIDAIKPHIERGATIVGLEPSCLFSMRDEFQAMHPGQTTEDLSERAFLFEEFLVREAEAGRIKTPIATAKAEVLVHGHCHQKAFGAAGSVTQALEMVDGYSASMIESSCCGMAGSFGYQAETYETSMAMGELNLLPAVRASASDTIIAADGFSCRHQIKDGANREARHVAVILADAMGL